MAKKRSSDQKFSRSHGDITKPVTERGFPRLRHVSVPGYDKGTGTPGYVAAAAARAEKHSRSELQGGGGKQEVRGSHRVTDPGVGAPGRPNETTKPREVKQTPR